MFLPNILPYPQGREALIFSSLCLDSVVGGLQTVDAPTMYQLAQGILNGEAYVPPDINISLLEAQDGQVIASVTQSDSVLVDKTYINSNALTGIARQIAALEDELDAHKATNTATHQASSYEIINTGSEIDGGVW